MLSFKSFSEGQWLGSECPIVLYMEMHFSGSLFKLYTCPLNSDKFSCGKLEERERKKERDREIEIEGATKKILSVKSPNEKKS